MPCYYPLKAWQTVSGDMHFYPKGSEGKSKNFKAPDLARTLRLPCGRCIGCKLEYSRQWAMRIMHEAQLHESNSFLTLTYNDDNVPYQGQLIKHHAQDFMKRLRYYYPNVRYYLCGEYGEDYDRPHFHVCLFGANFSDDRVPLKRLSVGYLYSSEFLDSVWKFGHCSVGDLTFQSAAYVSRYVTKKVNGALAESHYMRVDGMTGEIYQKEPEFSLMSLKPGIGAEWFKKYKEDVYSYDYVVVNGVKMRPPKFYDRLLERDDYIRRDLLNVTRLEGKLKMDANENSYERLRVREEVQKAKLSNFASRRLK